MTDELLTGWSEIDARLAKLAREAERLRREVSEAVPAAGADVGHVHEALVLARAHQDRLEEMLGAARRLRSRLWERYEDAEGAHEEATDRAVADTAATAREYATGPEKSAEARLRILGSKLTLRQTKRLRDQASSLVDYLDLMHRGVDGTRTDLRARVQASSLIARMEYDGGRR